MAVEQGAVLDALKVVRDPDLNRDIVSLGFIKELVIRDGDVAFTIELTTPACPVKDQMRDQARALGMGIPGGGDDFLGIALQITHDEIELCHAQCESHEPELFR